MSYINKGSMPTTVMVSILPDVSGNFVCDGTADDVEENAAIAYVTALGGGEIYTKIGTYDITAAMVFIGTNGDLAINFNCAGMEDVVFEPDATINCFEIKNRLVLQMRNFKINFPESGIAGHGIYGMDDGGASERPMDNSVFENIRMNRGSGTTTHWCVYIKNLWHTTFKNTRLTGWGNGVMKVESTSTTFNYADSVLLMGVHHWEVRKIGGYGLQIMGNATKPMNNIRVEGQTYIQGNVSMANQVAVSLTTNVKRIDISGIMTEYITGTNYQLIDCQRSVFHDSTWMLVEDGSTVFSCDSDSQLNEFHTFNIFLPTGDSATLINDAHVGGDGPNFFATEGAFTFEGDGTWTVTITVDSVLGDFKGFQVPAGYRNWIGETLRWYPVGGNTQSYDSAYACKKLEDPDWMSAFLSFRVPDNFLAVIEVLFEVIPEGTGNMSYQVNCDAAACGEASDTNNDSIGQTLVAVTNGEKECIDITAAFNGLTLTRGDTIGCMFTRRGNDVDDTVGADVNTLGIVFRYMTQGKA